MPPKLTQPLRPVARYRKGKAPVPVASDDSSADEQEQHDNQGEKEEEEQPDEELSEFGTGRGQLRGQQQQGGRMNVKIKEVEVDQGGKVKVGGKDEVGRTEMESSEGEYGMLSLISRRRRLLPLDLLETNSLILLPCAETDTEDEAAAAPAKPVFRPKAAAAPAVDEVRYFSSLPTSRRPSLLTSSAYVGIERVRDRFGGGRAAQAYLQARLRIKVRSFPPHPPVVFLANAFFRRRNRDTIVERQKELDPELQEAKREEELKKQRDASKNLVADSIVRELAESAFPPFRCLPPLLY